LFTGCPDTSSAAHHWGDPQSWWSSSSGSLGAPGRQRLMMARRVWGCAPGSHHPPAPSARWSACPSCRGGTRACSQPTAGCKHSRSSGGMAWQSWPPPSCPGRRDSSPPAPWPCSPLAAVGWGCQAAPSCRRCSSQCCARKGRGATVTGQGGEGWKKCSGPSRRKPCQPPRVRFPPQLTSAAASVAPGCPSCLKLAGPGIILQWLWAQAQRAARNSSPRMAPAPRPRSTLQTSQTAGLESRQKPAGWGWAPRSKQQGKPGHHLSLGDITIHH